MTRVVPVVAVVAALVLPAWPACAEHMTLVGPSAEAGVKAPTPSLDVDIKLGAQGFRIGGRLSGSSGVAGAWLNGQLKPDGFSLDGRVQSDTGRAYNFKLDADVTDWVARAGWLWLLRRAVSD